MNTTASFDTLLEQTVGLRQMITSLLKAIPEDKVNAMPPTWSNNARWHAGHLIITPYLLTYGIAGKPLPVPEEYRKWFAKGTTPKDWGTASIPGYDDLVNEIVPMISRLFEEWRDQMDEPYAEPYMTSVGVVLRTPGEALRFSLAHDGIHLGLLLALRRAL